jgi:primosomal protein N'
VLEVIETIDITENSPRTATIFTDSRISIDSLKNVNNHSNLIEEIRKRISILERTNWTIEFSWVKLAKAAARNRDTAIAFNRIPKSTFCSEIEEEAKQKWQKMEDCTKAAITKQFFPNVHGRLKLKINITPIFTAMVTGHGKTRAYLHRFKIMEYATCPCNKGDQTTDHLINQCTLLQTQRELFRSNVLKSGNWPVTNTS